MELQGSRRLEPDGTSTTVGFFGDPAGRCFFALHQPAAPPAAAVLICQPICAEGPRNYRREVDLARSLAGGGIAAFRFHYRGSGQSEGTAPGTIDGMVADARAALQHLGSYHVPIGLLGTGLGANVAAAAAADMPGAPIAMWEPAVDPGRYFKDVFRARVITDLKSGAGGGGPSPARVLQTEGLVDVAGYPITTELVESAARHPLSPDLGEHPRPMLVIEMNARGRPRESVVELARRWESAGHDVRLEVVEVDESWWFGASGRGGTIDTTATATEMLPITADFLTAHLTSARA